MALSTLVLPVSMITSTSGLISLILMKVSEPCMPGISWSSTTTSGGSFFTSSRAASPQSAVCTVKPRTDSWRAVASRKMSSSSTSSTLHFFCFSIVL